MLGEDQELPAAVLELRELGALQAALERFELRLLADRASVSRGELDEPRELRRPPRGAAPSSRRRRSSRCRRSCCSSVSSSSSCSVSTDLDQAELARASSRAPARAGSRARASMSANRLWRRTSELVIAPRELASRRWKTMRASATLRAALATHPRQELVDVVGDLLVQLVLGVTRARRAASTAWRSVKSRRPSKSRRSSFMRRRNQGLPSSWMTSWSRSRSMNWSSSSSRRKCANWSAFP